MKESAINKVLSQNYKLLKTFIFTILVFLIFRIIYFIRFGNFELLNDYSSDFIKAFGIGFRFDTQAILYGFSLIFILNFVFFVGNKKLDLILNKISKFFLIFVTSLFILILIIDQEFYTYFQQHINIMVFEFIEDDTGAVIKSIWTDHPVLILIALYAIMIFISIKVINKIYENDSFFRLKRLSVKILLLIAFVFVYGFSMRGTFGTFPLDIQNSIISKNKFINILCQNVFQTLDSAIKEHSKSRENITNEELLSRNNYSSIYQVLSDFYQTPEDSLPNKNYEDFLFKTTKTDTFLYENPPNVVFILAESFGNDYLNFHGKELNLLGKLEKHIHEDLFFRNFLSGGNGTIFSLENLFLNRTYPPLTGTTDRFKSYKSSVAFPYSEAGYETIFISGGKIGWRNLHETLPNQYFSQVYGQAEIMQNIKTSEANTWGVYDEFLFEEIYRQLSEKSSKPKLIIALTTTNHTPYEIPDTYEAYPVNIPDSVKEMIIANKEIAQLSFTSYQYANDKFGELLDKIKASELGSNTIIGYSGDHNSYTLFPYESKNIDKNQKHAVPFYLYVPEKYLKNKDSINTKRFGSHKDIFPTLFNLSLSGQMYFSLGNDLLDTTAPDSLYYGINTDFVTGDKNLSPKILEKKAKAYEILSRYYFNEKKYETDRLGNK